MARPISLLSTLVLLSATCLLSVRSESVFVQPPPSGPTGDFEDNQEYEVGDVINVQWESDLELMDVWLWQDYPPLENGLFRYFQVNVNTTETSMTWEVSFDNFITDIPEGEQAVFSFALYSSGFNGYDAMSHSFNVSLPREASTTTSSTQTEVVTATSTATDSSAGSDEKQQAGLSSAAIAGISLAATSGGLLLVIGAIFLGWKLIKGRDSGGRYQPGQQEPTLEEYKPEPVQYPPSGRPASQTYQQYNNYHTSANEPWRTSLPTSMQRSSYGSGAIYGEAMGYDQAYGHHYDPTTNYYPAPNQAHPHYGGYSRG